jgi:hypothetical protein
LCHSNGKLESTRTWMSSDDPAKLDAGHPCRHDDLHFHFLSASVKIMNHFVVYSLDASIYF